MSRCQELILYLCTFFYYIFLYLSRGRNGHHQKLDDLIRDCIDCRIDDARTQFDLAIRIAVQQRRRS